MVTTLRAIVTEGAVDGYGLATDSSIEGSVLVGTVNDQSAGPSEGTKDGISEGGKVGDPMGITDGLGVSLISLASTICKAKAIAPIIAYINIIFASEFDMRIIIFTNL